MNKTITKNIIWSLAVTALLCQFITQYTVAIISNQLTGFFNLTATTLAILTSSYYIIYVIMQTIAGYLIDKFGVRFLLSLGMLLSSFSFLIFAFAESYYVALISRIILGAGLSMAFVSVINISRNNYGANYFSFMIGLAETIAFTGTIICEFLLFHYLLSYS